MENNPGDFTDILEDALKQQLALKDVDGDPLPDNIIISDIIAIVKFSMSEWRKERNIDE